MSDDLEKIRAEQEAQKKLMEAARKKFDTTADEGDDEYEYYYGEAVNPWISIWFRPAATIRHILDNESWFMVFLIAIPAGMGIALASNFMFTVEAVEFDFLPYMMLVLCTGGLAGLVGIYFWAMIIQWLGTLMGGKGSTRDIMTALVWSRVPQILLLAYGLLLIAFVMQEDYFLAGMISSDAMDMDLIIAWLQDPWVFGYVLLMILTAVWGLIIKVRCLAEAQQYTSLQAFFNLLIAWGVVVGLLGWIMRYVLAIFSMLPPVANRVLDSFLNYLFMML